MITSERLEAYLHLVGTVRGMQREYRRTIDSRLRHRLPLLEEQLDRDTERLTAELLAAAVEVEAEQLEEAKGGAL